MVESARQITGYDIIGDIHGCDQSLIALLETMGYSNTSGSYSHPARQAIFVGDLIDRGPGIRQCLQLVRAMVEAGSAQVVLGNHEFNALRSRDILLRAMQGDIDDEEVSHHRRLLKLMKSTVEAFRDHIEEWERYLGWFAQLPLFIETDTYRVVHACWDESLIREYQQRYGTANMTPAFLAAALQRDSWESSVVDRLTRGTTLPLPDGLKLKSKDGFVRRFFRAKFWSEAPETYADVVFQPDPLPFDLQGRSLGHADRAMLVHYDPAAIPVFFGHYWLKGRPKPLRSNIACLDYSAVNYGRLVAYRFDGERELSPDNYVWVYVDP